MDGGRRIGEERLRDVDANLSFPSLKINSIPCHWPGVLFPGVSGLLRQQSVTPVPLIPSGVDVENVRQFGRDIIDDRKESKAW